MKRYSLLLLITSAIVPLHAGTFQWTNTLGGSWFASTNWSPNGNPGAGDTAYITNAGTYAVTLVSSASLNMPLFVLGGGPGTQSLLVDGNPTLNLAGWEQVATNGALVLSNCWMNGALNVQAGGQLQLLGSGSKVFYSLAVSNQGTITWSGGGISGGGSAGTRFNNSGLFLITGDNLIYNGGGGGPVLLNNSGTIRKTGGTGTTSMGMALTNQPEAVVQCDSGTLAFSASGIVAGSFVGNMPGKIVINGGAWTDAGGTSSGTATNQFSGGTFNLRTNVPPGLQFVGGDVYITSVDTFQQSGAITNLVIDGATLRGTNTVASGGALTFTSGSIADRLTIQPGGQWVIGGTASKLLYSLKSLDNQGTVLQGGSVNVSGNLLTNNGLWQFTGDYSVSWGGNAAAVFENNGIVRKTAGTGTASFSTCYFVNQPGGLVESLSGTLALVNSTTNVLGGTFTANSPAKISVSGLTTDAGGTFTGTGTNQFTSGTFYLRTNIVPGLQLVGGTVTVIGTNTFQNAGAITNLLLEGALLAGTHVVNGGTLTLNSGSTQGHLTVETNGQFVMTTAGSKSLYNTTVINRGTVLLNSGSVNIGGTTISNGGLWQITGDYGLSYGGGIFPVWTNAGTLVKTAGTGVSYLTSLGSSFYNQPGALVQVDSGTLQLPAGSTNSAGTLRLNGGTLNANGTLAIAGGQLEGAGTLGANVINGGALTPGLGGAGLVTFSSGLTLNSNATLIIDGIGPIPGQLYDQLSVTGSVVLGSCNLQIDSLPTVPAGTTFRIIDNDGSDAVNGTFTGLPENSQLAVGVQTFRIHYAGGTGNDVTLVRDGVIVGPWLSMENNTNGSWSFRGSGAIPLTVYTVRASTNLVTWTNIGFATSSLSGAIGFVDTNAWRYSRRFYNTTN